MARFRKVKILSMVRRKLRRVSRELKRLDVGSKGWKSLRRGFSITYRKGRRAYQKVLKNPSPENLHTWRKHTKDLWFQVRLLQPAWSEEIHAISSDLEALGEHLGDDHDLLVLRNEVEELGMSNGDVRELGALLSLSERRQRRLRTAALARGARVYADKSSTFCNRLSDCWRRWHQPENRRRVNR